MYQTATERKNIFWHKIFKLLRILLSGWNPVSTIQLQIMWKPWKRSFKGDTITQKFLLDSECCEGLKKLTFTSQKKDRVLHFLVRTSVTFLEAKLTMTLEYCLEEKYINSQCLPMTLYAFLLSWHAETWLSTILLATQGLHCCAAFSLFRS